MARNQSSTRIATSSTPKAWGEEVLQALREEGYGVGESILYTDLEHHFDHDQSCFLLRDGLAYAITAGWLLQGKYDDSVSFTQAGFAL